jgi:hypothetical protein
MANSIYSDESLQVLLFIAFPLILLLAAAIFFWIRHAPPSDAKFHDFSVSLSRVGREDSYIVYRDNDRRLEFHVGAGERNQALCLQMPEGIPDQDAGEIAQKLSVGLAKLGFRKYEILGRGDVKSAVRGPGG